MALHAALFRVKMNDLFSGSCPKGEDLFKWKTARAFIAIAAAAFGAGIAMIANAEYNYYMSSSFMFNTNTFPQVMVSQQIKNQTSYKRLDDDQDSSGKNRAKSSTATSPKLMANSNPLPYARDKAITEKVKEAFLQDFAKQMPETAKEMREISAQNDLVQVMAGYTRLAGLDSGTMEGVLALWYGQAWAIANQKALPSKQQYQGIASQLKFSSAKAKWSTMSNAERQAFYEHLAFPLFVQKANYTAYLKQGKTDSIARMSAAVREGFKKTGVSLESLQLSDSGFVRL
jgi:hypothetical protein